MEYEVRGFDVLPQAGMLWCTDLCYGYGVQTYVMVMVYRHDIHIRRKNRELICSTIYDEEIDREKEMAPLSVADKE